MKPTDYHNYQVNRNNHNYHHLYNPKLQMSVETYFDLQFFVCCISCFSHSICTKKICTKTTGTGAKNQRGTKGKNV